MPNRKVNSKQPANGKSYTKTLTIKMDPRVTASAADLEKMFALESKTTETLHQDYAALQEVRSVRSQLNKLKEKAGQGAVADAIAAVDKKIAALEETSGGFSASISDYGLARLNEGLNTLLGIVSGADAAPTAQAVAMNGELETNLKGKLIAWNELKAKELAVLNQKLKQANLPELP